METVRSIVHTVLYRNVEKWVQYQLLPLQVTHTHIHMRCLRFHLHFWRQESPIIMGNILATAQSMRYTCFKCTIAYVHNDRIDNTDLWKVFSHRNVSSQITYIYLCSQLIVSYLSLYCNNLLSFWQRKIENQCCSFQTMRMVFKSHALNYKQIGKKTTLVRYNIKNWIILNR